MKEKTKNNLKYFGNKVKKLEENIWNIPNSLTLMRVIITFIIILVIFFRYDLFVVSALFILGMITDFLDGNIARIFGMKTEFGRKFDMLADRFLFAGTVISLIIHGIYSGNIDNFRLMLIGIISLREILGIPFAVYSFILKKEIPHARIIGKITTFLQAIAFPAIILNVPYNIQISLFTGAVSLISGMTYAYDTVKNKQVLKK